MDAKLVLFYYTFLGFGYICPECEYRQRFKNYSQTPVKMAITRFAKSTLNIIVVLCFLTTSCKEQVKQDDKLLSISLYPNIEKADLIPVSMFSDNIEYIILDTKQDCLIGNLPHVRMYKDTLIVTSNQSETNGHCFIFDKNGRFISSISRQGKGDGEYRHVNEYRFNYYTGLLYFEGWNPQEYLKYTIDGKYAGRTKLNIPEQSAINVNGGPFSSITTTSLEFLSNDNIAIYHPVVAFGTETRTTMMSFISENDTTSAITITNPEMALLKPFALNDLQRVTIHNSSMESNWGIAGRDGGIYAETKEHSYTSFKGANCFWKYNNQTYFKECFNDTAYHVQYGKLTPRFYFDMGSYHWPYDKMFLSKTRASTSAYITWVTETDKVVLFQYFHDDKVFNGIYNKANGKVSTAPIQDGIIDDINNFMPVNIHSVTPDGNIIAILQPFDILSWFEENKEKSAKLPQHLKELRNISENANPVIAIIRQK